MSLPEPFLRFESSIEQDIPEDWDFYPCLVDEQAASVYLNLALKDQFTQLARYHVMYLHLEMQHPRLDGLSSDEEYDTLIEIEDHLDAELNGKLNALYVGRVTTNGTRDFFYYLADLDRIEEVVRIAMQQFPHYIYRIGAKPDREGGVYLNYLYPNERELSVIAERRIQQTASEI